MLDARLRTGGRPRWLAALLLASLLASLAVPHAAGAAESDASETYRVRIAARLTDDQRIEFGLRQLDQSDSPVSLFLAEARFFPLAVDHERWLTGGEVVCPARPHHRPTRGRNRAGRGQFDSLGQGADSGADASRQAAGGVRSGAPDPLRVGHGGRLQRTAPARAALLPR